MWPLTKLALSFILGSTLILSACEQPTPTVGENNSPSEDKEAVVSGEELERTTAEVETSTDDPEQFVGQTVVLNGEVQQVYGPNAFALRADGTFAQGDGILILVTGRQVPTLTEGETVQLTGEIQRFTGRALKGKYEAALDEALVSQLANEYEGRPFVITPVVDQLSPEGSIN